MIFASLFMIDRTLISCIYMQYMVSIMCMIIASLFTIHRKKEAESSSESDSGSSSSSSSSSFSGNHGNMKHFYSTSPEI